MIFTLRLSNCGFSRAIVPSSVVQTGVKSFGCEKSTPQELPSHSWKRIFPSVVSASKSGASSPITSVCIGMFKLLERLPTTLTRIIGWRAAATKAAFSGPARLEEFRSPLWRARRARFPH